MLKHKTNLLLLAMGSFCMLFLNACKDDDAKDTTISAVANMVATNSSGLTGTVTFTENSEGMVSMVATIGGISEGDHAIHIHEVGDCSAADGTSAGGHWNPTGEDHGVWGIPPFHRGDIGNIVIDANGNGTVSQMTDLWCIGCSDDTKNIVGKALIIHEGPDDFSSQPSGAAGPRLGCGAIERQ